LNDPDRKTLWGRAGSRCAFCNAELTTIDGLDVILGMEAHIHSPKPKGPRYDASYPTEKLETYANRILLCPDHHTLIDNNAELFPADDLRAKKGAHERRVSDALSPKKTSGWVTEPALGLITNGTELMTLAANAMAYLLSNDHPETDEEREAIGSFLQSVEDWGNIASDIGAGGQVDGAADLHKQLEELTRLGFVVVAGMGQWRMDPTLVWPAVALRIVRRSTLKEEDVTADPEKATAR
jgi:hypothetical protein